MKTIAFIFVVIATMGYVMLFFYAVCRLYYAIRQSQRQKKERQEKIAEITGGNYDRKS